MKARIGSVPYLNAKPLVEGLKTIDYQIPSQLAQSMREKKLDAALVPLLEVLEYPKYTVVDGIAIGSQNEVKSVFISYQTSWDKVKRVALDSESKTSVALAKIILEMDLGLSVDWVKPDEPAEAQLFIGDKALIYRNNHPQASFLDLAQAWRSKRNLPFVFAVWAIHADFAGKTILAEHLRRAKGKGLQQLENYGKTLEERLYLKENISYELGVREKEAISCFQQELIKLGVLQKKIELSWV